MRRSRLSLLFWTGLASSTTPLAACRDHVETIIVEAAASDAKDGGAGGAGGVAGPGGAAGSAGAAGHAG